MPEPGDGVRIDFRFVPHFMPMKKAPKPGRLPKSLVHMPPSQVEELRVRLRAVSSDKLCDSINLVDRHTLWTDGPALTIQQIADCLALDAFTTTHHSEAKAKLDALIKLRAASREGARAQGVRMFGARRWKRAGS